MPETDFVPFSTSHVAAIVLTILAVVLSYFLTTRNKTAANSLQLDINTNLHRNSYCICCLLLVQVD